MNQPLDQATRAADDKPLDTGLLSLCLLARLHQTASDPKQLAHQLNLGSKRADTTQLLLAAKELGLKATRAAPSLDRLSKAALPAIAKLQDGRYVVLAQCHEDFVLYQDPAKPAPTKTNLLEFSQQWSGELILIASRASP